MKSLLVGWKASIACGAHATTAPIFGPSIAAAPLSFSNGPDRQPGGVMDLLEAKSRIAEALVESIFRRARYQVEAYPAGRTPLRFFKNNIEDHEGLVRGIFGRLAGA